MTTASIFKKHKCSECDWPIIEACCNDEFASYRDACDYDWWLYCSNKGCKNHIGEGYFQDLPDWIEEIE